MQVKFPASHLSDVKSKGIDWKMQEDPDDAGDIKPLSPDEPSSPVVKVSPLLTELPRPSGISPSTHKVTGLSICISQELTQH